MVLSKSCTYGLRAAIHLASGAVGTYVSIRELSGQLGLSFHFLTKILQSLTRAGILESQRGPKGGVALSRPADRISVFEIIIAIDGRGVFENCILGLPGCGIRQPCPMHDQWAVERTRIESMMRRQTLESLAGQVERGRLRLWERE